MANVLKTHVVKNHLYTTIVGKNYAHVEGWQFAGGMLGLFPRVVSVKDLSDGKTVKWMAEVEIVDKESRVVSRGFAVCSKEEAKKKSFDEYAILSMAQTRAIGKAYRNLIGWVMKLAGYEGTPSEEMRKVDENPANPVASQPVAAEKFEDHICVAKGCGRDLTKAEANYSKKMFGKELCRTHQAEAKRK